MSALNLFYPATFFVDVSVPSHEMSGHVYVYMC